MSFISKIVKLLLPETQRIVIVYPKKSTNTITYTGTCISTTTSVDVDTKIKYSTTSGFSKFKLV